MTSQTAPKTVDLGGDSIQREKVAAATITPGHLLSITSLDKYTPHADAGGEAQPCFAVENDMVGRGIDDTYAAGDQVFARIFSQGAGIYPVLAVSQTVVIGDRLTSNGNGQLKKAGNTDFVVAVAREAITTTAGATQRIRSEVYIGRGA